MMNYFKEVIENFTMTKRKKLNIEFDELIKEREDLYQKKLDSYDKQKSSSSIEEWEIEWETEKEYREKINEKINEVNKKIDNHFKESRLLLTKKSNSILFFMSFVAAFSMAVSASFLGLSDSIVFGILMSVILTTYLLFAFKDLIKIEDDFQKIKMKTIKQKIRAFISVPIFYVLLLTIGETISYYLRFVFNVNLPGTSINQTNLLEIYNGKSVLFFIYIIILIPILEELINRKIIIELLEKTMKNLKINKMITMILSIIISSLVFAFLHVVSGDFNAIIPYLVWSFGLGIFYYFHQKNVIMTIALHSFVNLIAFLSIIL